MYYTYILFSEKLGKYYTGQTEDMDRRLDEHNRGKTTFMKFGIPWKLVFLSSFSIRGQAMALEKKIKQRGAKRFLEDNEHIAV
jgi:putative endonuclease